MAGQQPPPPPPWQPLPPIIADANADCSIGLCNAYCPQWCYAPPNPLYRSSFDADDLDDPGPGPGLSPVVVVVIAFLAAALLLTSAYFILHRYRRRNTNNSNNNRPLNSAPDPGPARGLDESLIDTIAVCRYRRGEGLVGGTSCSVCLSDFREEERLRLLPNCSHAFHVACVDSWLKSHPNCPLCRAGIAWASPPPAPRRAEVAVAVEGGSGTGDGGEDDAGKRINNSDGAEFGNGGIRPVRRSSSPGDGSLITGTSSAPVARSLSCGRSSFDRRREGGVQPV